MGICRFNEEKLNKLRNVSLIELNIGCNYIVNEGRYVGILRLKLELVFIMTKFKHAQGSTVTSLIIMFERSVPRCTTHRYYIACWEFHSQ